MFFYDVQKGEDEKQRILFPSDNQYESSSQKSDYAEYLLKKIKQGSITGNDRLGLQLCFENEIRAKNFLSNYVEKLKEHEIADNHELYPSYEYLITKLLNQIENSNNYYDFIIYNRDLVAFSLNHQIKKAAL